MPEIGPTWKGINGLMKFISLSLQRFSIIYFYVIKYMKFMEYILNVLKALISLYHLPVPCLHISLHLVKLNLYTMNQNLPMTTSFQPLAKSILVSVFKDIFYVGTKSEVIAAFQRTV